MKNNIFLLSAILILYMGIVSAIDLDITIKPISSTVIQELENPALYSMTIRNNGESETFEIYSLVGIDISHETPLYIAKDEEKTINLSIHPQYALKNKKDLFILEIKIRNQLGEIQEDKISLKVQSLENSFEIIPKNINIDSEFIEITIRNKEMYDFSSLNIRSSSTFFDFEKTIDLPRYETITLQVPLDKKALTSSLSGKYLIKNYLTVSEKTVIYDNIILNYVEKIDITTQENEEGILIHKKEITKKNQGNSRSLVTVAIEKDIITSLFTTFNIAPSERTNNGLKINYFWKRELYPQQEFTINSTTNWFYPIIIIILIILLIIVIKKFLALDLLLRKDVSFVRTKGGEFALKVMIRVRAKKFIEEIKVTDRLPLLVHLYDKFGSIHPDFIDEKNKRLEWNIECLNKGEERVFTYIIYSKIGVVGRFELPNAHANYLSKGEKKVIYSNKAFYAYYPKLKKRINN